MPATLIYIHHEGQIAGSAISLRNLIQALDRERFAPRILLADDGPARDMFESLGVPVDVLPISRFWTIRGPAWYQPSYFKNLLALLPNRNLENYFRLIRPDIIHINEKCLLSAGLVAKRLNIPVVWHLRCTYQLSQSRTMARISKSGIKKAATRILAISEDEADGFVECEKLRIVYNSVDSDDAANSSTRRDSVRSELGLKADDIAIGMVGYLTADKGAWQFIRMAGLVNAALPDKKLRFFIVAKIPGRDLRPGRILRRFWAPPPIHAEDFAWQLAEQAGISDRLVLTGFREDVLPVNAALDIVVSCYQLAAIGRTVLEAMAVGRPVVVTAGHSGKSQIVKHAENGFVAPPGDVHSLAQWVIELVEDRDLRQEIGGRALEYSRLHFDARRNARRVEEIYSEVLNPQKKTG
ncbi:MAG: glycosyltransferase family 1 protein [Anaerolineae bacterium]|nr:MAG: glycosyltransferase family 1 protein [Anaerolineae bacterium]